nr:ribonuclease H-like domain-containing protein [Tanacetum cinerariifolium]
MAFLSSPSSNNKVDTASIQVSTTSTSVSTVSSPDNTANLSDATVYAFLANQPNGSQLVREDLEQIYEDDLEEIDLKWQLALLSMRARRYFHRTGKKITINGSDTAGYDKTKVKCFNCHKMGYFSRECESSRNQESMPRNQDSSRKTMIMEDTSSKAMLAINGAGFPWSYMADDEVPTNIAFMAFSDSKVHNSKTCSNTCLKSFETLKTQYDNLRIEFNKSEFDLATYKRGLAYVEEQLVFYKKNEVVFCNQIAVFKRDASFRDSKITTLNLQIEKLKKEKESNQIKINNFKNASMSLDKLIGSQITDNSKIRLGFISYNAVAPLPTCLFVPPTIDLSNTGLKEFKQLEFEGYGPKDSKCVSVDTSNEIKKALDALIIKDWVSDSDEDESKEMILNSKNVQHKPEQANQHRNIFQAYERNISYLTDFKEHDRGYVAFGGGAKGGKITDKGTTRTGKLDFEATKDETSMILKSFIIVIENLVEKKVKIIKCDNGTKFKNRVMNEFCEETGIKREYSMARTPQQNEVAERRNRTLIEAARTMLADYKLPTTFWAEAVHTACYVQNKVLVVKPHFKTAYELFKVRSPALSFMRLFGCHVSILNTLDQLGKFDGKSNDGIFVGYSKTSKSFRVYNIRTRKDEKILHITYQEKKPMITGGGPEWYVVPTGRVVVPIGSMKRTGRDHDERVIILPPMTAEEHIAIQKESKARTTLLQSIPDDHVVDFHYMDDARDICNAVKARFSGNVESKKMRKSMPKQEFLEFKIGEAEGLHKGYDRIQKIMSQ